jgi:hypothetical protein
MEDAASQERLVATGTLAVEGAKGGRVHKLRGLLAAVIVVGLLAVSGCNGPQVSKPKVISCSIQPVALMARAIAGDSLKVQVLSGSDAAPLSNARELLLQGAVTFEAGMPADVWCASLSGGGALLVDLSTALEDKPANGSWLSFRDAAAMARHMRDTLSTTYPELKGTFDAGYTAFVDKCSKADSRLKQLVWKARSRAFLAPDNVWSGAAHDYGLSLIVRPELKGLDLTTEASGTMVKQWGELQGARVVVIDVKPGEFPAVQRQSNGLVLCALDPLARSEEGSFVEWLEAEHTLLGSALAD